jgi:2-dehydro-3-deoxyglucarate aldolase/4-hydroxy-2-oxoheptanedioate aldolase
MRLRDRIDHGAPTLGTFNSLGSALATEACAVGGFDWVLIDLEHGGGNEQTLIGQLRGAQVHGASTVVRVETADRIRCGRALDLGADGIMLPRLESAESVREALAHLKFPPYGDRGVATYHPAAGFGLNPEYIEDFNDQVVAVVQIETLGALAAIDEIAAVAGVDVLFIGPRDLASALGVGADFTAPAYQNALASVVTACQRHGRQAGILASDAQSAARLLDIGFTFVAVGSDSSFVASQSRLTVTEFKKHLSTTSAQAPPIVVQTT